MTMTSRKERSRSLILDAAAAAVHEFGLDAVSMEQIAARAGLTRKTVYNLFGSKDEVAFALLARVEAQDAGYRAGIAANADALGLLERVLLDSAGWCLANPSLARLALNPAIRPTLRPPERPSFQGLVRDILLLGQHQQRIRADEDADFLALLLLGIYGQAMVSALSVGQFDPADIHRIIRVVIEGIGTAARPG